MDIRAHELMFHGAELRVVLAAFESWQIYFCDTNQVCGRKHPWVADSVSGQKETL